MSPTVAGLLLIGGLLVLLGTGMPIAFALGLAAVSARGLDPSVACSYGVAHGPGSRGAAIWRNRASTALFASASPAPVRCR